MKNILVLMAAFGLSVPACTAQEARASKDYGNASSTATSASADLDGDGRKESIRLVPASKRPEESRYKLFVGGQSLSGELEAMSGLRLYVIDINRADRYKEVVVQLDDIHADFDSNVYSYDGHRLRLAGRIHGIEAIVRGDGTVLEESWRGFWTSTDTFRLSRSHKLVKVPHQFYAVNKPGTVIKSLPLHPRIGSSRVSATLRAGTKVMVAKSDLKGWFLLRAESGVQGWVKSRKLYNLISGLPVGD